MASLNCPSCGGAIEGVSPHIRSIDCTYCGAWIRLSNELWQAQSGQDTPLGAPSFLRVGMQGQTSDGAQVTVRGRIRFQYNSGTWDEWWFENNQGEGFWVEEDDGTYYHHTQSQEITLPPIKLIVVGDILNLPKGYPDLLITERFDASIMGREGMLPVEPEARQVITYMDGVADGNEFSLEVDGHRAYLSQSAVFPIHGIQWRNT